MKMNSLLVTYKLSTASIRSLSMLVMMLFGFGFQVLGQKPAPPLPVEMMAGHRNMYYQMVVKKSFDPQRKVDLFGLATYTANYENRVADNRLIMITQLNYNIGKGFGAMAGIDINSFTGLSPIIGPQHHFANKDILAITVLSYFLNGESDLKLFGLYEYKPTINERWAFYSRFQFIYNHGVKANQHNVSYVYLRAGLKRKSFIFGLGANVDWSGPHKDFQQNYGGFVRWEFQ